MNRLLRNLEWMPEWICLALIAIAAGVLGALS